MPTLEVHPLTADRWPDLVDLFSRRGAAIPGRCWCMYYRQAGNGDASANRTALRSLVGGTVARPTRPTMRRAIWPRRRPADP